MTRLVSFVSFFSAMLLILVAIGWRARVNRLGGWCFILFGFLALASTLVGHLVFGGNTIADLIELNENTAPGFPARAGLSLAAILAGILFVALNRE